MNFFLVAKSANSKTGPIAVSYAGSASCPRSCPLRGGACYAEAGFHTRLHWRRLDAGRVGGSWASFLDGLLRLKAGRVFRYGVAGDLPGIGERVSRGALAELVEATRHLLAFTYTHKKSTAALATIRESNAKGGLLINVSADSLVEADRLHAKGFPVAVTVPRHFPAGGKTPGGRLVAVCPAQLSKQTTCSNCGNGEPLCARRNRDYVIGFRAHGAKWRQIG